MAPYIGRGIPEGRATIIGAMERDGAPPAADAAGLLAFARDLGRLKRLRRQGWIDREVREPESVADHTLRIALLAWVVAGRLGLDADRALKLGLLHDLAEAHAGDLTPFGDLSGLDLAERRRRLGRVPERTAAEQAAWERAKRAREEAGLEALLGGLRPAEREALRALWLEYEEARTAEARLVKQLDRVETWLQALEYLAAQPEVNVASFRRQIETMALEPALRALVDAAEAAP